MPSTVRWSQLGSPTEPVEVTVAGIGVVAVSRDNIRRAQASGQVDPVFMLTDISAIKDIAYKLGRLCP